MKKLFFTSILSFALASIANAQSFTTVTVKDSISTNTTWTSNQQYLLKGYVYVTNGTTLTIEPGTIIRGDKSTKGTLIIERGAKIMANGTKDHPIVFTSAQKEGNRSYGDWGGVILCGKAPVNWTAGEGQVEGGPRSFYGGTDAADNSGKLSYVRIEFGGVAFSPNNEVNGLTLCGVGNQTQIDHIQVAYSGDDAIEWFGGTVNAKYLVAQASWDDDFDTDNGFSGMVQYGVVVRDEGAADVSGSKAFESDSYQTGTADGKSSTAQATKPVFSNMTIIGPISNPASTTYNPYFVAGAHIRRGSALSLVNSVLVGFPCGILLDEASASYGSTTANIGNNLLQIRSNIIAGMSNNSTPANKSIVYVKDGARSLTPTTTMADSATSGNTNFSPYSGPWNMLKDPANLNVLFTYAQDVKLTNPFPSSDPTPNLVPLSASPILFNSGKNYLGQTISGLKAFDVTKPINLDTTGNYANYNAPQVVPDFGATSRANDAFFDKTNYVGAFTNTSAASDNWMDSWTNFDPNNTFYEYVLAVNDVKTNIESAKVFPNPATNNAVVNVTLTESSDLSISIVDMTGKKIKEVYTGTNVIGAHSYNVDLTDLTTGLYLVSITSGSAHQSIKLSVIK